MGKLTALRCAHCEWSTGKFDWRSGKAVPSFVALYRHVMSEHAEELGIRQGEWDMAISEAEATLGRTQPGYEPAVDYTRSIEGSLDIHNTKQKAIAKTRDALPRLSDAIIEQDMIGSYDEDWRPAKWWLLLQQPYCVDIRKGHDILMHLGGA